METREIILDILQEMHEDIDYEKEKALVTDKIWILLIWSVLSRN